MIAHLGLNFCEERLGIDIERGFAVCDDGTARAARFAADIMRFKRQYFLNGVLEVWDLEKNRVLGRCDPFMPVNVDLAATAESFERLERKFNSVARERESGDHEDRKD